MSNNKYNRFIELFLLNIYLKDNEEVVEVSCLHSINHFSSSVSRQQIIAQFYFIRRPRGLELSVCSS